MQQTEAKIAPFKSALKLVVLKSLSQISVSIVRPSMPVRVFYYLLTKALFI